MLVGLVDWIDWLVWLVWLDNLLLGLNSLYVPIQAPKCWGVLKFENFLFVNSSLS